MDRSMVTEFLRSAPWPHKMAGLLIVTLMSACWLRLANRSTTLAARLAALAPIVALNSAAPLLFPRFSEPVSLAFSAFLLTWLGNFKAVAAACGRGPLAQQPWSLLQFWALYVLPILPAAPPRSNVGTNGSSSGGNGTFRKPRKAHHKGPGTGPEMFGRWLLKAAATAAVVFALLLPNLPPFAKSCLYVLGLYTMLGVVMDGPAALVLAPLQLKLAPHFLPPWESRSLADFWGLHWNQAASNALRTAIYEPIVQGSLLSPAQLPTASLKPQQPSKQQPQQLQEQSMATAEASAAGEAPVVGNGATPRRRSMRIMAASEAAAAGEGEALAGEAEAGARTGNGQLASMGSAGNAGYRSGEARRLLGMIASFFASGLAHELIFWYVQGSTTGGLAWLWFFTGQVPLIIAERFILRWLKQQGASPPELLRIAVTLGVLLVSAHWLFFLPAEAAGVPARFAESMRQSFAALASVPAALLAAVRGGG